jgi:actin-related protein
VDPEVREKTVEIFFETFNVPSYYVANQALLSLFSSGRTTAIVVTIGDSVTQIVPIHNMCPIRSGTLVGNFGGRDITDYFCRALAGNQLLFTKSAERQIAREIKEKLGYIALDFHLEMDRARRTTDLSEWYLLPDGKAMVISDDRFRCPELLFKPHANGFKADGVDQMVFDSIMASGKLRTMRTFTDHRLLDLISPRAEFSCPCQISRDVKSRSAVERSPATRNASMTYKYLCQKQFDFSAHSPRPL